MHIGIRDGVRVDKTTSLLCREVDVWNLGRSGSLVATVACQSNRRRGLLTGPEVAALQARKV